MEEESIDEVAQAIFDSCPDYTLVEAIGEALDTVPSDDKRARDTLRAVAKRLAQLQRLDVT